MIDTIIPLLVMDGSSKLDAPNSNRFIANSNRKLLLLMNRYWKSYNTANTVGVGKLKEYIMNADISFYCKQDNDMSMLSKIESDFKNYKHIDPWVNSGFINADLENIHELIIPFTSSGLLDELPIGSKSLTDWVKVSPLTILDNDSIELSLDLNTSRYTYDLFSPDYCIWGLNVPKLIMCYCKFLQLKGDIELNIETFLFKLCVVPTVKDNFRCWYLNQVSLMANMLYLDPEWKFDIDYVAFSNRSKPFSSGVVECFSEVRRNLLMVREGTVNADSFLKGCNIGDQSIMDYILERFTMNHVVYGEQQYQWLEVFGNIRILTTLLSIYGLGNKTRYDEIRKRVNIEMKRLQRQRVEQHVKISNIKKYLKELIDDITEYTS